MRGNRRDERGLRRPWRALAFLVAFSLLLTAMPAGGQETFDDVPSGEWRGSGEAGGWTNLEVPNGRVRIFAQFALGLQFMVTLMSEDFATVDGHWNMDQGTTQWHFISQGADVGGGTLNHTASGMIGGATGAIETFNTLGATITSTGTMSMPSVGAVPIDDTGQLDDLEMKVTHQLCNDTWGEWVFSWNTQLSEAQLTPSFTGNWHAVRIPPSDDDEARQALEQNILNLLALRQDVSLLMRQPTELGVPIVPYDAVWSVIQQAVHYINLLNNLGRCEKAYYGEDNLADYVNALTNIIRLMINVLLDNYALEGEQISDEDLLELTTLAASVGAIGDGAVDEDAAAFTQERLRQEATSSDQSGTGSSDSDGGGSDQSDSSGTDDTGFGFDFWVFSFSWSSG